LKINVQNIFCRKKELAAIPMLAAGFTSRWVLQLFFIFLYKLFRLFQIVWILNITLVTYYDSIFFL
jgi:hypothetical protein